MLLHCRQYLLTPMQASQKKAATYCQKHISYNNLIYLQDTETWQRAPILVKGLIQLCFLLICL